MNIRSVLLVEDEAMDRVLLTGWLQRHRPDLRVFEATCLSEARRCLQASSVDVILLDLGLPDDAGLLTLLRHK